MSWGINDGSWIILYKKETILYKLSEHAPITDILAITSFKKLILSKCPISKRHNRRSSKIIKNEGMTHFSQKIPLKRKTFWFLSKLTPGKLQRTSTGRSVFVVCHREIDDSQSQEKYIKHTEKLLWFGELTQLMLVKLFVVVTFAASGSASSLSLFTVTSLNTKFTGHFLLNILPLVRVTTN